MLQIKHVENTANTSSIYFKSGDNNTVSGNKSTFRVSYNAFESFNDSVDNGNPNNNQEN
jgi:hypothetical protein